MLRSPDFSDSSCESSVHRSLDALSIDEATEGTMMNTSQNARQYMLSKGYHVGTQELSKTLQGSIWCGVNVNNIVNINGYFNRNIVIKVTNKDLHCDKITVIKGQSIKIQESIISEMMILKYLTNHGISFGLNRFFVNYIDFFDDIHNFYLVMENGGSSLFSFVVKSHQYILSGKLGISEWKNVCRNIFTQMVTFTDILHNSMGVCHLDISLENILINDVIINVDHYNNMIHFVPNFTIKFCDFGLSEIFDAKANPQFLCNKWVGKIGYQSPEIYQRKSNFNAKAADIWSLGVCLFTLLIGYMPYNKPSMDDAAFQWITKENIFTFIELIKSWKKLPYTSAASIDILWRIFKKENQRITAKQLLAHEWIQSNC